MTGEPAGEIQPLRQAVTGATAAEMCEQLGRWLGHSGAVSETVLTAALADPGYARRLTGARGHPEAIAWLLARPPRLPESARRMVGLHQLSTPEAPADAPSNAVLAQRFAASMARWTASGFAVVEAAVLERRWAACQACPHLTDPPRRAVYRLAQLASSDSRVCGRCGCVAAAKVRLPHESCPEADPADPGRTRWGEPRRAAAHKDSVSPIEREPGSRGEPNAEHG